MNQLPNSLESPFLDQEILAAEPRQELAPRVTRLAEESPFERVSIHSGETDPVAFTQEADPGQWTSENERLWGTEDEDAYEYRTEVNEEFEEEFAHDEIEVEEISVEEEETADAYEHLGLIDEAASSPSYSLFSAPAPMSNASQVRDKDHELIRWMSRVEQQIASLRSGLGGVDGGLRVDRLMRMQKACQAFLGKLISVFWAQDQNSRASLLAAYLSALIAFKLFCDDVYIEAVEEARQPKNRGDAPSPNSIKPIEDLYRQTIEDWIVGSPLINPATFKDNHGFLPKISNMINLPYLRKMAIDPFTITMKSNPRQAAKDAVKSDLQRIRGSSTQDARVSTSTDHLLGVVFLLAQLEIKLRWENDQTRQSDVDGWYEAALRPVKVIADEVLGIFDDALRAAVLAGKNEEADRLLSARHLTVNDMATRYSLRRQETRVLLSFFEKQNKTGRFAYQDIVEGVNRVKETLFAYVGRPNPDNQANRAALSVADVRAKEVALAGMNVKVFGLINSSGTKLTDEMTKSPIAIGAERDVRARGTIGIARRVIVEGSLTGLGKTLEIEATSIVPHSEGYRALVGFPLRFAQTDRKGNLEQLPLWRRSTDASQRAAVREIREEEEGVFSVAETLAGQRELVTDLLRHEEVRKAFATSLKKGKNLNLQNTEVRVKVWSVLFKELAKNGNRSAVRVLIAYLQRYLALFTRHSYFNLRDSGTPYVDSKWPTDLTNRKLHDCGVYAVQAAYDLFRAVAGTPNLTLEFRFLTFLNHMCLIVFFDNAAFLVNNAKVYPPGDIKPQGTPTDDEKVAAAFQWGGLAFTTVYDVSHMLFLAVLPQLSVKTNRSDADFKKAIWKTFLDSQGWGISNNAAIAGDYFKGIALFDANSIALAGRLKGLKSGNQASADDWNAATTLALDLYKLGEAMSEFKNFVFFNTDFVKNKPIPAIGFAVDREVVSSGGSRTLPMYDLAELLSQRKKSGQRLTADQNTLARKLTGFDHVSELTERFRKAAAKP